MPLTNEILTDARALKPAALESLLATGYAPARRVAHALTGNEHIARAIGEVLLRRSLRLLPRWQDPSSAENWFYHHAVLTARSVNLPAPDPLNDPLVIFGPANDPAFVAFIRAIRILPIQQREAFILHHGERLNSRLLAVSMDCSTQAATTHLEAATAALRQVTGEQLETFSASLTRAYGALQSSEPDSTPLIRVFVRNVRRRVWLRRVIWILLAALLAEGIGWAIWFLVRGQIRT